MEPNATLDVEASTSAAAAPVKRRRGHPTGPNPNPTKGRAVDVIWECRFDTAPIDAARVVELFPDVSHDNASTILSRGAARGWFERVGPEFLDVRERHVWFYATGRYRLTAKAWDLVEYIIETAE